MCLSYALSQPASVVIHGMEKVEYLDQALDVIKTFKPLTSSQILALTGKVRQAAMSGKYELFKTTAHFDAAAHIPRGSVEKSVREKEIDV